MHGIAATKDAAQAVALWASTLGALVATFGGILAYVRYRRDLKQQQLDHAFHSYQHAMEIIIQNPEFYPGSWSAFVRADPVARHKFHWVMGRFLWACEEVLAADPDPDRKWRNSVVDVFSWHVDYFEEEDPDGFYDKAILDLIHEAVAAARAKARKDAAIQAAASGAGK